MAVHVKRSSKFFAANSKLQSLHFHPTFREQRTRSYTAESAITNDVKLKFEPAVCRRARGTGL